MSQLVVFKPALKSVSVTSNPGATVFALQDPGAAGVVPEAGVEGSNGQLNVDMGL